MVKMSAMKNFGELVNFIVKESSSVCSHQGIHFVFCTYLQQSLKESERIRRESASNTIDLALIDNNIDR